MMLLNPMIDLNQLGTTIETVTEQIKKATDDQIKIAERRAELAARERKVKRVV